MTELKVNQIVTLNKGSYQIIEKLDGGGQGNVWKVKHDRQYFALKIPLSQKGKKRAEMEIGLMGKISPTDAIEHFIAPCHDTGTYLGLPVLVTPFYPNNLENYMPVAGSVRALPAIGLCLKWISQILCALQKTHSLLRDQGKELVHRDIKAANLCLDRNNDIRLIDFGIAKDTDALSTFTSASCELAAAPEQCLPSGFTDNKAHYELGAHVDIYALGLIIFRLFTGASPQSQWDFQNIGVLNEHLRLLHENQIGKLGKIGGLSADEQQQLHDAIISRLSKEPTPLADNGDYAQKLVAFVVGLLNPRYQNRPKVAAAKQQIDELILALTAHTSPQNDPPPLNKNRRFRPWGLATAGLALVAAIGWQWPTIDDTVQLWRIGQQLEQGTAAERLDAWRALNNRVSVSGSIAAAEMLAEFEQKTQDLLNSTQPEDQHAAVERLRLSAEKGDQNAMLWMAYVNIKGQGTQRNWQEAEQWYKKAVAFNNPEAQKRLQRLQLEMAKLAPSSSLPDGN